MKKLLKNKKGAVIEALFSMWKIAFALIMIVMILLIVNEFNNKWQTIESTEGVSRALFDEMNDRLSRSFNWGSILLYLGFLVGSILIVLNTPFSIARIFVGFIVLMFFVILLIIPSNLYGEIQDNSDQANTLITTRLPILDYFMDNLVQFGIVYFVIVGIALYTKRGT